MKRKLALISLLAVLGTTLIAGQREDIDYIDKLYKARDYKVAILELENFLEKYPNSRKIRSVQERLGKTYFLEKNYEESKKYFDILIANYKLRGKMKDEVFFYQVRNTSALKNFEESQAYLENVQRNGSYYEQGVYYLALGYYDDGHYDKAQKEFTKLISSEGEYYDKATLYMGLSSYNNGQYVKTLVYLDEYYKGEEEDKNYPLMNYIYGSCYYKMDDLEKAKHYFSQVAERYPEDPYAPKSLISLISIYKELKDEENMMKAFQEIQGSNEAPTAYKLVAEYQSNKGDYKKARKYYSGIISDTKEMSVIYGYAYSLYRTGEIAESLENFKKLEDSEFYDEYIYYTTKMNYENRNYSQVLELVEDLKEKEPKSSYRDNVYLMVASSAYETEDYKLSRDYYLKVYESTYRKDELYKLILVDSKIGDLKDLEFRFDEYRKTFIKDQQYKKDAYLIAGAAYYKSGDTARAEEIYSEYLKDSRDNEIIDNMVALLLNGKKYKEMKRYLNMQSSSTENAYYKGIAALGLMKYSEAEFHLKNAVNSTDEEIKQKAQYNLFRTYFSWERSPEAVEAGEIYLVKGYLGNRDEVIDKVGISYFKMEDYQKSRETYELLKDREGYKEYVMFQIAESFFSEGKYGEAARSYREIYAFNPQGKYTEDSMYWEINSLYLLKNFDLLQKTVEVFKENYPKSEYLDNIMTFYAEAFLIKEDLTGAAASYEEIYEKSSRESLKENAVSKLAEIYYDMGDFDKALIWVMKLPEESKTSHWKALIYEKKGDVNLANSEYQKLLNDNNYKDAAAFNLANYYYKNGDLEEAKKNYQIIVSSEDSKYKDKAVFQLGSIYGKQGDYEKALEMYRKVNLDYEDSPLKEAALIKTASTYEALGDEEHAQENYIKFIKGYGESKFKEFALEKLILSKLKEGDKENALLYFEELKKDSPEKSKKYTEYFKEGNEL